MASQTDLQPPFLPPGFRFHPTDEELVEFYLRKRAAGEPCPVPVIAEVDIYKFNPWELPPMAKQQHQLQGEDGYGCSESYFFSPRERKYPNGVRPNRAAGSGYWKATGTDRPIVATSVAASGGGGAGRRIGVKKALVFYKGKPPRGSKTNWIMHEFRLTDQQQSSQFYHMMLPVKNKESTSMRLDDWVLCRIYEKTHSQQQSPDTPTNDLAIQAGMDDSHKFRAGTSSTTNSGSLSNILCGAYATDYSMLSGQLLFTTNNSKMNPPSDLHQQPRHLSSTIIQSPANTTTAINPASLSTGFFNSGDNIDSSGVNPVVVQPISVHHQWAPLPHNLPALDAMMTTGGLIGLKRQRESADGFDFRHVHSCQVNGLHPAKNDPTDRSRNFTNTSSTAGSTSCRLPAGGYGNLVGAATQFDSMDQLGHHDMLPNPNFLGFL